MKRLFGLAVALAVLSTAPLAAQEAADSARAEGVEDVRGVIEKSGVEAAIDSIATTTAPELQAALDELAATVTIIVERVANDPELRTSALQAAEGVVELAQVVVAEQSDVILEVLREAAERVAVESATEKDASAEENVTTAP